MNDMKKVLKIVLAVVVSAVGLWCLHYGRLALLCDSFVVRGCSMEPSLHDGEKIWVNKLRMGARIYTDFDFSKPSLSSVRLPGFSPVEAGDLVVANYPYAETSDSINFRINYVFLKRCYGAPGDTVLISDGFYRHPRTGGRIGDTTFQHLLHCRRDSLLVSDGVVLNALQHKRTGWTIRDFGPLYVPRKGDTVSIDRHSWRLLRKMIRYETGKNVSARGDTVFVGGVPVRSYTFRSDWYFLGGDNVLDSRDSRYIGLFPEAYLVGAVWER